MVPLKEQVFSVLATAKTDAGVIAGLRPVVNSCREAIRTAREANKIGHEAAEQNIDKGLVKDPFRERALVDFLTGLVETDAKELKSKVQGIILTRRVLGNPNPETAAHQWQRLKRLGIL